MNIKKAVIVYFSPTGGTRDVARLLGARLGVRTEELDVTAGAPERSFGEDELAVFAFPVYGGRIPAPMHERMKTLRGARTPAVLLAVFGNRAVDDALLEMKDKARDAGFVCVAAAEFVAPHSVCPVFGAGRPDRTDVRVMDRFAFALRDRLSSLVTPESAAVPGSTPFREYKGIPMKPEVTKKKCTRCGKCAAHCPVTAISAARPDRTDKKRCISCMGCISVCPTGARHLPPAMRALGRMSLKKLCRVRREPKYYV